MINTITKSFTKTKQKINGHKDYPTESGIYAFFLSSKSNLSDFGRGGQLIYIGIAKKSLHDRDFNQHFKSGRTGSSTLRRSIGAVLKDTLYLNAIPRGGANDTKRFDNYKFEEEGILTDWMKENLEIGYWISDKHLTYEQLREREKEITIALRPTLDLDPRTKRHNPFAGHLDKLRDICRKQAGKK